MDAGDLAVARAVLRRFAVPVERQSPRGWFVFQGAVRLVVDGAVVKSEERIDMQRRIRDVLQARDGSLLVISDDKNGELLRVSPGASMTRQ